MSLTATLGSGKVSIKRAIIKVKKHFKNKRKLILKSNFSKKIVLCIKSHNSIKNTTSQTIKPQKTFT